MGALFELQPPARVAAHALDAPDGPSELLECDHHPAREHVEQQRQGLQDPVARHVHGHAHVLQVVCLARLAVHGWLGWQVKAGVISVLAGWLWWKSAILSDISPGKKYQHSGLLGGWVTEWVGGLAD